MMVRVMLCFIVLASAYSQECLDYKEEGRCQMCKKLVNCSETDELESWCPPGQLCSAAGYCKCGAYPTTVLQCNKGFPSMMLEGSCAMLDKHSGLVSVGSCLHYPTCLCSYSLHYYYQLPADISNLNRHMCGTWNRVGTLCGRCMPNHYPLAYSYNMTCVPCPHMHWNWVKYFAAAYLPLTLFFLVIVFLKVNTTSSHLFALVCLSKPFSAGCCARRIAFSAQSQHEIDKEGHTGALLCLWNMELGFLQDILL